MHALVLYYTRGAIVIGLLPLTPYKICTFEHAIKHIGATRPGCVGTQIHLSATGESKSLVEMKYPFANEYDIGLPGDVVMVIMIPPTIYGIANKNTLICTSRRLHYGSLWYHCTIYGRLYTTHIYCL